MKKLLNRLFGNKKEKEEKKLSAEQFCFNTSKPDEGYCKNEFRLVK